MTQATPTPITSLRRPSACGLAADLGSLGGENGLSGVAVGLFAVVLFGGTACASLQEPARSSPSMFGAVDSAAPVLDAAARPRAIH